MWDNIITQATVELDYQSNYPFWYAPTPQCIHCNTEKPVDDSSHCPGCGAVYPIWE